VHYVLVMVVQMLSINQPKHISIEPYAASESEALYADDEFDIHSAELMLL